MVIMFLTNQLKNSRTNKIDNSVTNIFLKGIIISHTTISKA